MRFPILFAGLLCCVSEAQAQPPEPLKQIATIALPNVAGRIDHLAFDAQHQRLFVAALGNGTVEVLDTASNTHLKSLPGFHEPQGIAVAPDFGAVAIANGDTGTLQLLDAETFATRWTVEVGGDADNVRYDAAAKQLYVAAQGGLYRVDPASGKVAKQIAIDGHPESFQLEAGGTRVFANLPGVLSSQVETSVDVVGDTDDLFFDAARQRVYVIGGEGYIDVVRRSSDVIDRTARVATRAGARTGLWVAATSRLYVAVPARDSQAAEVRVFEAR